MSSPKPLFDIHSLGAAVTLDRIAASTSLYELWHLREQVFSLVACRLDQNEAARRVAELDIHFPRRKRDTPLPAAAPRSNKRARRPAWALSSLGIGAEEIALSDLDPALAQQGVSHGEVEEEVRQHGVLQVGLAGIWIVPPHGIGTGDDALVGHPSKLASGTDCTKAIVFSTRSRSSARVLSVSSNFGASVPVTAGGEELGPGRRRSGPAAGKASSRGRAGWP